MRIGMYPLQHFVAHMPPAQLVRGCAAERGREPEEGHPTALSRAGIPRATVRRMTTTRELLLTERTRAQQRAAALGQELAGISEAAAQPGTDDEHDPEGATLAFERQHTAALLARALEQITEIDAAISRLDHGTYGSCVRCGSPIGEDRLAARPAAATCLRCARLPTGSRRGNTRARRLT
jgi:DnaK suppressor protein